MSNPIHVVLLLLLFGLWFGQAYLAGRVAVSKGRSFGLYLTAGLVIGLLVVLGTLLLPRRHIAQ